MLPWLALALGADDPLIADHLREVVDTLRAETPADLSPATRARRLAALDALASYAEAGDFPDAPPRPTRPAITPPRTFNPPDRADRAPLFQDADGTWCAVGYLLALDAPAIAAHVAATDNDGYLLEIDAPGLADWAARTGFTPDELAWIQPNYESQVPACAEFALVGSPAANAPTCDGAALVADPAEVRLCQDCGDEAKLWYILYNTGSADATDVRLDIAATPSWDTAAGDQDWRYAGCGITVPAGQGVAVGPIPLPGGTFARYDDGLTATWSAGDVCLLPDISEVGDPMFTTSGCEGWDTAGAWDVGGGVGAPLLEVAPSPCPDEAVTDTDDAPTDTDAGPTDTDAGPTDTGAGPTDTDRAPGTDTDTDTDTDDTTDSDGEATDTGLGGVEAPTDTSGPTDPADTALRTDLSDSADGCGPYPLPPSADTREELGMWCGDAGDPWTVVRQCTDGDFVGGWEIASARGWDTTRRWIAADGSEIVAMNRRDEDTGGCRAVHFGEPPACNAWVEVSRSQTCSVHALEETWVDTAQEAADPVADWWGANGPIFPDALRDTATDADTDETDDAPTDAGTDVDGTDATDLDATDSPSDDAPGDDPGTDTDSGDGEPPGCACDASPTHAPWLIVAVAGQTLRRRRAQPAR